MRRRTRSVRAWPRADGGASAVEFALIAPLLLLILAGVSNSWQFILAVRHVVQVSATVGNLAAEANSSTLHDSDVQDIFSVGSVLMQPASVTPLSMRMTSIEDTGTTTSMKAVIQWSNASGTMTASAPGTQVAVPTGLLSQPGDSVILSEVTYTYTPQINILGWPNMVVSRENYYHPRQGQPISRISP